MGELLTTGLIGKWGFEYGTPIFFLAMVFCIVVPYLLGSISFSVVFSRALHHDDVREHGSGNAGSTNMLRTYGLKSALLTLICDILKGVISAFIGLLVMPYHMGFAYISALTGQGIEQMIEKLEAMVTMGKRRVTYVIPNREAGELNTLYRLATVESVDYGEEAITVVALADARARGTLKRFAVDDIVEEEEE